MTQLSISSGSLENMLDVVDTILFNVLERMKRGGSSRENHVFPEDLFKCLETKIDEIVEEQNCNGKESETSDFRFRFLMFRQNLTRTRSLQRHKALQ